MRNHSKTNPVGLRVAERERLKDVQPPAAGEVRKAVREFMSVLDLSIDQMAGLVGKASSSLRLFIYSDYCEKTGGDDIWIRRAIWEYLERNPIASPRRAQGRLFVTENYRLIRRYFSRAVEHGEVALVYGPPGTQKTFAFEHLLANSNRTAAGRAIYVYASNKMRPVALLKRIGRAAGIYTNLSGVERLLASLLHRFNTGERSPAVLVDEAQHLNVDCLEILRELHDRSDCGLVLAGSHNLYENFLRGRTHLEQWLSRIDYKEPLPGLGEKEVAEIAARELGNGQPAKLSEHKVRELVKMCTVEDVFARTSDGKPTHAKYLSVRRLVKSLAQLKEARNARAHG